MPERLRALPTATGKRGITHEATECVFVDESASMASGLYLLSAVFVRREDQQDIRHRVEDLRMPGQTRLHWRNESGARRIEVLRTMCDLGIRGAVLVVRGLRPKRQDRARALALNALVWDMRERQVDGLLMESRGTQPDAADRSTIAAAMRARRAPPSLRYAHAVADSEPLLWIADALAGAQNAVLSGRGDEFPILGNSPLGAVQEIGDCG